MQKIILKNPVSYVTACKICPDCRTGKYHQSQMDANTKFYSWEGGKESAIPLFGCIHHLSSPREEKPARLPSQQPKHFLVCWKWFIE